jgi:hypothetical protein
MQLTRVGRVTRSVRAQLFVSLLAVGVLGCPKDSTGPTTPNVVGTFELSSINGSLPYTSNGINGTSTTYESGSIVLRDNLSFSQTITYRTSSAVGVFTASTHGTYTQNGSSLSFSSGSGTWSGTANASGITLNVVKGTDTWVFVQ